MRCFIRINYLKIVAFLAVLLLKIASSEESVDDRRLILISLDGFRWDYLNGRAHTPTFNLLKRRGAYAREGIRNVYLTNTLPNHFSMVTGLYVESHGMLDNIILDPDNNKTYVPVFYDHNVENDPSWLKNVGEPIWVSNHIQKHGKSGVLMWMGGETKIRGVLPTKFFKHTYDMREVDQVDMLLNWLTDPKEPIDLAVVYFPEPDSTGHKYGPESEQVTQKIKELDKALGHLLQQLEKTGLSDNTDILITSDHGFTSVSQEETILIDDIVDPSWYRTVSYLPGPVMSIFPNEGMEDKVYSKLKSSAESTQLFQVYKSQDIPERFHYKAHARIPPIFATAILGYSFVDEQSLHRFQILKGNHGYDNEHKEMRPFFLAYGPSFKENFSVEPFQNVDIYPLMCHLKGIKPTPNNGSMKTVSTLLRHYQDVPEDASLHSAYALVFLAVLLVIIVFISLRAQNRRPDNKLE